MIIDSPKIESLPELRELWREAFGDTEEFIDAFFSTAFSPERCRTVEENGKTVAALYWFDCSCRGQRIAYLYAIATAGEHRGRGICHRLMENTHRHLELLGYRGAVLVPGGDTLIEFYEKIGYSVCSGIARISCTCAPGGAPLRQIDSKEYSRLRRELLPEGGVLQEGESLKFLEKQASLYAGEGFLLAARAGENTLYGVELLGDVSKAPAIVKALGCARGYFRVPGCESPFAMYLPLGENRLERPSYFGIAFD